jgi:hypothetical protein
LNLAPITLFVYNRPWHTRQTIEALQKNELAEDSELFIFSDGPKNEAAEEDVREVRGYIRTVSGFKNISIIERAKNWGLAASIIDGVTKVLNEYGRVIVLEDDLVTSPYFLRFMNEALILYQHEEKVISIHGYIYSVKGELPQTFFLKDPGCWGWATWKRGWDIFQSDGQKLLNELREKKLTKQFDYNGAYPYTKMLEDQIYGKNNSWAVRWYAATFLKDKLTLYPGSSLVQHIGNDGTGTHCGKSDFLNCDMANTPVSVERIGCEENVFARKESEKFFKSIKLGGLRIIAHKIMNLLKE